MFYIKILSSEQRVLWLANDDDDDGDDGITPPRKHFGGTAVLSCRPVRKNAPPESGLSRGPYDTEYGVRSTTPSPGDIRYGSTSQFYIPVTNYYYFLLSCESTASPPASKICAGCPYSERVYYSRMLDTQY